MTVFRYDQSDVQELIHVFALLSVTLNARWMRKGE
jgi:hypothetical protein